MAPWTAIESNAIKILGALPSYKIVIDCLNRLIVPSMTATSFLIHVHFVSVNFKTTVDIFQLVSLFPITPSFMSLILHIMLLIERIDSAIVHGCGSFVSIVVPLTDGVNYIDPYLPRDVKT